MVQGGSFLKAIGRATLAHVLGRIANVLIPLAIISVFGADRYTDQFFFVLAVAFFFSGTTANAVTETTVPLLLSGKLRLSRCLVLKTGLGLSCLVLLFTGGWRLLFGRWPLLYAAAIGLMSGAGLLNGLATGARHAREAYLLPGLTWLLRLLPLTAFLLADPESSQLVWLALGLGAADWLRGLILTSGPALAPPPLARPETDDIRTPLRSYLTVMTASMLMGLNPIVDRMIAQRMGPGAVSILETGERFYGILGGLATLGLMTVLLTRLSQQEQNAGPQSNWRPLLKFIAVWSTFWLLVGIASGVWGLDLWMVNKTPLSPVQSASVKWVYWYYLMGLPAFILTVAYVKRFQARTHFHILVLAALLAVALNIPASLFLAGLLGVPGIALATTLIYTVIGLVLMETDRHSHSKADSNRGFPPATVV